MLYNQGTNGWSAPKRWPIDDGQLSANALCAGDLNGDGRTDLVLLGENCVYFLPQKADHTLGEPREDSLLRRRQIRPGRWILTATAAATCCWSTGKTATRSASGCRQPDGELGPEIYFSCAPIRSYWADNLEPNKQDAGHHHRPEFRPRARFRSSRASRPSRSRAAFRQGQFQVLPLNKTDKARRGLLWADVNGDGLPDLLVAEPESGQISLYLQQKDGSLAAPKTFPTLAGISDLAVADWNGDGKPEIFMLSADERQVGVTRLDEKQRLPFPDLDPAGRQTAGDGRRQAPGRTPSPSLAVIVDQDGKDGRIRRCWSPAPPTARPRPKS